MRLGRRLVRSAFFQSLLAYLLSFYLRLIHVTNRWTIEIPDQLQAVIAERRSFLACFWHSRLGIILPGRPAGYRFAVLISGHRDGVMIARAISRFDVGCIAGSSSRGGAQALRAMTAALERPGTVVGVTPDGPRGPRMRAKPGALKAAQLAGVPLVPAAAGVSRRRLLGSWDRFCLPLPFGRGLIKVGAPMLVPRDADDAELERLRRELEERLNLLMAEVDRRLGHLAVEPAPLDAGGKVKRARA